MERQDALEKLLLLEPGLADNDLIPALRHFAFTGQTVLAYNDRIAISVPLRSEFKGGVPGKLMLELLKTSNSNKLELVGSGENAELRIGRAKVKLGMMPVNEFMFKMPTKNNGITPGEKFLTVIEDCLQSVSAFSATPDQLGVTLVPEKGDELGLFSSTGNTMTAGKLKNDIKCRERVILPADFCKQMLRLSKTSDKQKLLVANDHALFSAGDALLFGRLLTSDKPLPFAATMERHTPKNASKQMVTVPEGLRSLLERAVLITNIAGRNIPTTIKISKGRAVFSAESERGSLTETLGFGTHPDIETAVRAETLLNSSTRYEKLLLTNTVAVMSSKTTTYIMSAGASSN